MATATTPAAPSIVWVDPISDPRWDRFVGSHTSGWICHLSGWKRTLEQSFRHIRGYYAVLLNERDPEKIDAGFPVFSVRSWLTGNRLVSIPYASICDPLVSNARQAHMLLNELVALGSRLGAKRAEIRTFKDAYLSEDARLTCTRYYKCHYILLDASLEVVKKQFHRSCVRQRIDRALKSGLKLKPGEDERDLRAYYELHKANRVRKGLPVQPFAFYRNLWRAFEHTGQIRLRLCVHQGRAIAGMLLFCYNKRVSAEGMAWSDEFNDRSPGHFLFWEAIQEAHREQFEIFDFGRTAPDNRSLMEFKSRWGTSVVDLPQYFLPERHRDRNNPERGAAYRMVRMLCRIAPARTQESLGRVIYRHLG
jgi:hypothetical protein